MLLKFGVDIQSQTEVTVWKPKNPIWPPGGHFESDVAKNHQAAILKVTSQKIIRFLPMATTNRHMKFEIEIPKQTRLALRKPWHLQTDRQGESSLPPSNYFRREHKNNRDLNQGVWNIWSKFGDCCLKGRWVRVRTSSGMMHGHTQIDTCNNNIWRPRKTRATLNAEIPLAA